MSPQQRTDAALQSVDRTRLGSIPREFQGLIYGAALAVHDDDLRGIFSRHDRDGVKDRNLDALMLGFGSVTIEEIAWWGDGFDEHRASGIEIDRHDLNDLGIETHCHKRTARCFAPLGVVLIGMDLDAVPGCITGENKGTES